MSSRHIKMYESITDIPEKLWDAILTPSDIFHTHRFIKVVEKARIENCQCWFLCFFEKEVLVATAALSAFRVDLSLFLGEAVKNKIDFFRRIYPPLMKPKILFCGLPVSLGQRNVVIATPGAADWVWTALDRKMQEVALRHKLRFFCFKEFDEESSRQMYHISSHGYFKGFSLPYMDLGIQWSSFASYLEDLRHGYRRQIMKSLEKVRFATAGDAKAIHQPGNEPIVRINHWNHCPPSLFYELYLEVMGRTPTKLETLNASFFEQCFETLKEDLILITVEQEAEVLSAGLLFHHHPDLTFALVGNKYQKLPEADPYFNLVNAMIQLAIQLEVERLRLGQTAYWVKQRIGGMPSRRYIFFKAKNRMLHFLLKSLKSYLFPETNIPLVHVFKKKSVSK